MRTMEIDVKGHKVWIDEAIYNLLVADGRTIYVRMKKNAPYFIVRWSAKEEIYLHQLVRGKAPEGYLVDHINGNTCDNRFENLRIVSRTLNNLNTKAKNYEFHHGKYVVYFNVEGKRTRYGRYETEEEAIQRVKEVRAMLIQQLIEKGGHIL